jgi:hypothetical protein
MFNGGFMDNPVQFEQVQLIFGKGLTPISLAIRLRYQSRWTHVGVIIDGVVHEAVYHGGVIKTPLNEFKKRYGFGNWDVATALALPGWRERAESLIGIEYDWWGAAGIGFGTRKLDDPNKLWCSHHAAIILGTLRPERLNRLAPEHLWIFSQSVPSGVAACQQS